MTNEQAIKVLLDEWKCIDRNDGINCNRQCEKCDLVMDSAILKDAYNIAIQALSQEPSRDMEEIAEIMKCDVDAETKCKMISNILTAKPHYFEKQKPTVQDKQAESEKYQKAFDDGYANGYAQARFDYEQEPCEVEAAKLQQAYNKGFEDCRQAAIEAVKQAIYNHDSAIMRLTELPSVTTMRDATPKEQKSVNDYIKSISTPTGVKFEDAISRQAVMDCFKKWQPYMATRMWDFEKELFDLPPVTQKTGKWISIPYELDYETDAECSLCHEKFIDAINYDYCPKCGYRMQKSEDER